MPQLDLLREARVVGGERRCLGQSTAMARRLLGFLQVGEKEGEREQHVVEELLILQRGARERGGGRGGHGDGARGGSVPTVATVEDGADSGDPLSVF